MRNRARIAICALLMLELLIPSFGAVSQPQMDGDDGMDETRSGSVPAYGYGGDIFSDPVNTTVFGSANVSGGFLRLTDLYNHADFDDGTLQGWELQKTFIEVKDGHLRCNGGRVGLDTLIDNFKMNFSVMMTKLDVTGGGEGFAFYAWGQGEQLQFYTYYENRNDTMNFKGIKETGERSWISMPFTPSINQWYRVYIEHIGEIFNVTIDGTKFISMKVPTLTDVRSIQIGAEYFGDVLIDDVIIRSPDAQGHAITQTVTLPFNRWWDYVQIGKFENRWSKTKFTVLMPYANHVFPAHANVTGWSESITDIYMDDTDKLYLDFWMTGEDGNFPRVDWWRIYWKPDPPTQTRDIPDIDLREDEPQLNVVDLTNYFADWYVAGLNLAYSVEFCSNYSHVRPVIESRNLSIELPTKDWYGTETVRVNCSDGEFNVTSRNITVNVSPVNDPPAMVPFATLDVFEENATTFNITPFLADIDTLIENLTVRADSPNCTVSGQNLTLLYTVGNVYERIPVHVSDGEFEVSSFLQVHVINVNDPPIVLPIPKQTATEEVLFVIDLGPFLSDEETPVSGLIIMCEHPNLVSIDGLRIVLMFPEYIAPTTVEFNISDGTDAVSGSFELEVVPVNDPPVLKSIGGIPLNGTPSVELREGEEVTLPLEIIDVDSQTPRVYVESDLAGVEILANGSLRIVSAHGEIGTFWASLMVDDQDGGNFSTNLTIVVVNVNDPPAVPRILSPVNGTSFNESVAIVFNGVYDDLDMGFGQVLQIVWATNGSGEIARFSSDEAGPFSLSNLTPGQHVVTVTASDGEFSSSASVTISIKAKEVPPIEPPIDDGDDDQNGGISILLIGVVVAIIMVLIGVLLFLRSRKGD